MLLISNYKKSNRVRMMDPSTGRFLSEDPIGFAGGDMNLYRYVGNNPVNYTDPSGNISFAPRLSKDTFTGGGGSTAAIAAVGFISAGALAEQLANLLSKKNDPVSNFQRELQQEAIREKLTKKKNIRPPSKDELILGTALGAALSKVVNSCSRDD